MTLFRYDSTFSQFMMRFVDILFLGFLWTIFSLPLVTVGAATAGLYYAMENAIRQDRGHIWQHFWRGFVRELGPATVLWLLQALMIFVFWADWRVTLENVNTGGQLDSGMLTGLAVAAVVFLLWSQYWLAYQARYQDKLGTVIKNTFLLALSSPILTFGHAVLVVGFLLAGYLVFLSVPLFVIPLPGLFASLSCWLLNKIFKKHETVAQ